MLIIRMDQIAMSPFHIKKTTLMGTIAWEDSAAKKAGLHPGFFADAATAAAATKKQGG